MTTKTRIHRPRKQSPAVAAKERAKRTRFQRAWPGLADLLASGEYSEPVSQGEYWELRQTMLRLKALRESAGLSLAEMSTRTGIDRGALSRLETGVSPTPRSTRCPATPKPSGSSPTACSG